MSELATTYVRIRPRTAGFKSEADADLRREKPNDVSVDVTANTRPADDRLRAFNDKLDVLRLKTATVSIDVNDRAATGKLAAIDAALARLDHARANPRIDLEGVAKAEAQIEALNLQLDRLNEKSVGGRGGGGGLLGRLGAYGSRGGFFSPGGLAGLGVAAAPAAVPLGIGALGLGASFVTPAVAGTAGLGLFGAGATGAIRRVSKNEAALTKLNQRIAATSPTRAAGSPAQIATAEQRLQAAEAALGRATPTGIASAQASVASARLGLQRAQGGGANPAYDRLLQQRQQLLKQMTPAERDAAKGIDTLEDSWKRFQRGLEPETFKLLATGTTIFRKGLHDLLPMTKAVGDEVDHLAKRAEKALDDPFWQHFFRDFLTREAPRAVDSLFVSIGHVVEGFAHLAEQWAPLGHSLEDDLVSITARFDKWSQGQGPLKFMALVEKDGPIAAQAVEAIAHALVGLANGLEPIGRIELQALTPVLNFIGEVGRQHPQIITDVGIAYLTVAAGLKAIGAAGKVENVLKGVTGDLSGLRKGALLTAGAIGAYSIGAATAGGGGKGAVEASLGGALTGLTVGLAAGGPFGAALGAAGGALVGLAGHFLTVKHSVDETTVSLQTMTAQLSQALQLDRGVAGSNVKAFITSYLQRNTPFAHQLATSGVKEKDLIAYLSSGGRIQSGGLSNVFGAAESPALNADGSVKVNKAASDAMAAILAMLKAFEAATRQSADVLAITGGGQTQHGGGRGKSGGKSSVSPTSVVPIDLSGAGIQAGGTYVGGVATGIDQAATKADAAAARLATRIKTSFAAILQERQQLTTSLLSETGLGAFSAQTDAVGNPVAPTAAGIEAGLRHQRVALRQFRERLHREEEHGLSVGAEKQILGLGLGRGGAFAASLAHASDAQLRSISHLLRGVHGDVTSTSRDLSRDIYGPRIEGLLKQVRDLLAGKEGKHLDSPVVAELKRLREQLEAFGSEVRGAQHKHASRTS